MKNSFFKIVSFAVAMLATVVVSFADVTVDGDGWHVVSNSVDTRSVYLDPVGGSNSNDGLTSLTPKQTWLGSTGAWNLIRAGMPDHLYVKTGSVVNEVFGNLNKSGRSATEPIYIGSYGSLSAGRPVLTGAASTDGVISFYSNSTAIRNVFIQDIEFRPTSAGGYGVVFYGSNQIQNITFEGCEFHDFDVLLTAETAGASNQYDGLSFYRNVFRNAYSGSGGHKIGMYLNGCNNLGLYENVFYNNGMGPITAGGTYGAGVTIYNHNCYVKPQCTNVTFSRNFSIAGASHGLQLRSGGTCEDNIFSHNAISIMMGGGNDDASERPGGVTGVVRGNAILKGRYLGPPSPGDPEFYGQDYCWAMEFKNSSSAGFLVEDNIVANSLQRYTISLEFDGEHNFLRNVTYQDNVHVNWPGAVFFNSGGTQSGHIVRRNIFQEADGPFSLRAGSPLVDIYTNSTGVCTFTDNKYYDEGGANTWVVAGNTLSFAQWQSQTGESGAVYAQQALPDPTRTCETYAATKGLASTIQVFAQEAMNRCRRDRYDGIFTPQDVMAYLRVGYGLDSAPVDEPPPAPSSCTASSTIGGASVSWAAVSEATGYKVYSRIQGGSWDSGTVDSAPPYVYTGLTAGTTYEFRVTATNDNGESGYSSVSTAIPLPPLPAQVTGVSAAPGASSFQVSWSSVSGATSYLVYKKISTAPTWDAPVSKASSPHTFSGLVPNTGYDVRVSAVNAAGEGPYSDTENVVTYFNVPSTPTGVSATAGSEQMTVSWTASVNANAYNIQWRVVGAGSWGASTPDAASPYVITGLTAGLDYEARVSAVGDSGESEFSAPVSGTVLPQLAAAPGAPSISAGPGSLIVDWTPVSGAASYLVYVRETGAGSWPAGVSDAAPPLSVVGLTPGTEYEVAVSSVNAAGESAKSTVSTGTPTVSAPLAPSGVSVTGGELSADVSWTASAGATNYYVYYRAIGASTWSTPENTIAPTILIDGLTPGQWQFAVTAINNGGESPFSTIVTVTVVDTGVTVQPATPTSVMYRVNGANSVSIRWDKMADATGYVVRYGSSSTSLSNSITISDSTQTIVTIVGLSRGQTIYFSVWSVNAGVFSENGSAILSATPKRRRHGGWRRRVASKSGRRDGSARRVRKEIQCHTG